MRIADRELTDQECGAEGTDSIEDTMRLKNGIIPDGCSAQIEGLALEIDELGYLEKACLAPGERLLIVKSDQRQHNGAFLESKMVFIREIVLRRAKQIPGSHFLARAHPMRAYIDCRLATSRGHHCHTRSHVNCMGNTPRSLPLQRRSARAESIPARVAGEHILLQSRLGTQTLRY